jgi:DNA-binding NarL/FixJ family response regulator
VVPVRRVLLVSDDIMFASQLKAAVEAGGGVLDSARRETALDSARGTDAVFVDLNSDTAHRLGLIASLRESATELRIIAFCHHGHDETRRMAMQVGASSCITNGALQAVAMRLGGTVVPPGYRA